MVRLTSYMKAQAARGNARVTQGTLDGSPTIGPRRPMVLRDHATRTRSGRELRALPFLLCMACVERLEAPHRAVYAECAQADCGNTADDCEQCGRGLPDPVALAPDTRAQSWRRWGR